MSSKNIPNPIPSVITPEMLAEYGGSIDLREWFPPDKYILAIHNSIINYIPPGHKIIFGFRSVDAKLKTGKDRSGNEIRYSNDDCYPTPKSNSHVSLKSTTIIAIGRITGVFFDRPEVYRERDAKTNELLSITVKAMGQYCDYTGHRTLVSNEKSIDFTVLKKSSRTQSDVQQIMTHGIERATTGAMARAIAKEFGIKSSFFPNELEGKQFVGVSLELDIDYRDPRVQHLLLQQATSPKMLLYGNGTDADEVPADYEVEDVPTECKREQPAPEQKPKADTMLDKMRKEAEDLCKKIDYQPKDKIGDMDANKLTAFIDYLNGKAVGNAK